MAYFLLGALAVYLAIALALWARGHVAAVRVISTVARGEGYRVPRWRIEVVVLWLYLAWPWPLLEAWRKP